MMIEYIFIGVLLPDKTQVISNDDNCIRCQYLRPSFTAKIGQNPFSFGCFGVFRSDTVFNHGELHWTVEGKADSMTGFFNNGLNPKLENRFS